MIPSGELVERFEIQKPVSTRNEAGESETTWAKVATVLGSYEAVSYGESARRGQTGGNLQATVTIRHLDGITGEMRLVWKSNANRVLMISSVVPVGRREDLEITVEEQVA